MTERWAQMQGFIEAAGWADAVPGFLAGDASNRKYYRLSRTDGTSAVLMDAPADKGEDTRPFIAIARHLTALGLSAPDILHSDPDLGFLLIEDLGDDLFSRVLDGDTALENTLYSAATDVLVALHAASVPDLTAYDAATAAPLAALAFDWYLRGATGDADQTARTAFQSAFAELLSPLDDRDQVLIQRDYHAENLLWLPQRTGVSRVGLLDFQDSMRGHRAYDLVSILQDARRDVPEQIERAMIARYLDRSGLDRDAFHAAYALQGAQRNLRILGVFARLCMRDGKVHYVDLIPRVWAHLMTNLAHQALAPIAPLIHAALPAPTPAVLEKLKSQCATDLTP